MFSWLQQWWTREPETKNNEGPFWNICASQSPILRSLKSIATMRTDKELSYGPDASYDIASQVEQLYLGVQDTESVNDVASGGGVNAETQTLLLDVDQEAMAKRSRVLSHLRSSSRSRFQVYKGTQSTPRRPSRSTVMCGNRVEDICVVKRPPLTERRTSLNFEPTPSKEATSSMREGPLSTSSVQLIPTKLKTWNQIIEERRCAAVAHPLWHEDGTDCFERKASFAKPADGHWVVMLETEGKRLFNLTFDVVGGEVRPWDLPNPRRFVLDRGNLRSVHLRDVEENLELLIYLQVEAEVTAELHEAFSEVEHNFRLNPHAFGRARRLSLDNVFPSRSCDFLPVYGFQTGGSEIEFITDSEGHEDGACVWFEAEGSDVKLSMNTKRAPKNGYRFVIRSQRHFFFPHATEVNDVRTYTMEPLSLSKDKYNAQWPVDGRRAQGCVRNEAARHVLTNYYEDSEKFLSIREHDDNVLRGTVRRLSDQQPMASFELRRVLANVQVEDGSHHGIEKNGEQVLLKTERPVWRVEQTSLERDGELWGVPFAVALRVDRDYVSNQQALLTHCYTWVSETKADPLFSLTLTSSKEETRRGSSLRRSSVRHWGDTFPSKNASVYLEA
ncbi:MAG: uncharacterized protein KVP18_004880 [Porospora cf. gigantea A]|uniref:uncharacterized protein n=1 Tax=Porospora cf. gigantea A TaxID=2853593 RepID=UPI003559A80C|nr:MAG: hypothetical protein KVP18_004880 [Porospora cf. gigantea A]